MAISNCGCTPCQPETPAGCEPPIPVSQVSQLWGHDANGCVKALSNAAANGLVSTTPSGAKSADGSTLNPILLPALQELNADETPKIFAIASDGTLKAWEPSNTADNFLCYWDGTEWKIGTIDSLLPSGNGVIFRNELGALAVASGSDGQTLRYVGTAIQFVGAAANSLPRGSIFGLTLSNNGSDANNDVDIAEGQCRNSANTGDLLLTASITKRSDAVWASGTGNGGMDTGTKPTSGTLHVYLISDGSTVDAIFSASVSGPLLPGGYTTFRRIGAVLTDSSSNIRGFTQTGEKFMLTTPVLDFSGSAGTTAALYALSVPSGLLLDAFLNVRFNVTQNSSGIYFSAPAAADLAASGSVSPLTSVTGTSNNFSITTIAGGALTIGTNTARQIRGRCEHASTTLYIATLGWIDERGRLQ